MKKIKLKICICDYFFIQFIVDLEQMEKLGLKKILFVMLKIRWAGQAPFNKVGKGTGCSMQRAPPKT